MAKVFIANGRKANKRNILPLLVGNPTKTGGSMAKKKSGGLGKPKKHRKNPFIGEPIVDSIKSVLSAAVGFLGEVYGPAWLLGLAGQPDTGALAYLIAAGAVFVPAWGLHKFGAPLAAKGWLAGSGAGFAYRVVDDVFGQKLMEVQVPNPQSATGMSSFFVPADTVLPGPNVFGQYAKRRMLPAGTSSPTSAQGQGQANSTMAISKPVSGMGWARWPYAA